MDRDLKEDLRVAHAKIEDLSPADRARRADLVKLLRTFAHELEPDERRHCAEIRRSFTDPGDYVEFLGTRRSHAWVMGELKTLDGRLRFRQVGSNPGTFDLAPEIAATVTETRGYWFGLARTNRASYPVGPVVLLEKMPSGKLPTSIDP